MTSRSAALVCIGIGGAVGLLIGESFEPNAGRSLPPLSRTPAAAAIDDAGSLSPTARLRRQLAAERAEHRAKLAKVVRLNRKHRAEARRYRSAVRASTSITRTIELSARAYGVPASTLLRKAYCESRFNPAATNGRYVGIFQFGAPLWSTTPYGDQARTDPLAASLAAAWAHANGYASHWECR